jgi:glycerophosphoryl diester phosphodiesterase
MKIRCALLFAAMPLTVLADSPIVIAHRGASGYLPEHTLEAKALAFGQGAHYLEQDVVLTKDRVPVVLHDIHVDAISDVATRFPGRQREDGRFYALDFTLAELRTLHLTERFNPKTGEQVFKGRFPKNAGQFRIVTFEEELTFIASLNQSTGKTVGIYPEIKQPAWHREQGFDISPLVLEVLKKFGYTSKEALCYLQCFEHDEVKRLRHELGWQGRLIQLMSAGKSGLGGSNYERMRTPAGLTELAQIVDGIGPAIASVIDQQGQVTALVADAHGAGLAVHPYTLRSDDLPAFAPTPTALLDLLFGRAKVDGLFTDFPDVCLDWLKR